MPGAIGANSSQNQTKPLRQSFPLCPELLWPELQLPCHWANYWDRTSISCSGLFWACSASPIELSGLSDWFSQTASVFSPSHGAMTRCSSFLLLTGNAGGGSCVDRPSSGSCVCTILPRWIARPATVVPWYGVSACLSVANHVSCPIMSSANRHHGRRYGDQRALTFCDRLC